MKISASLFSRKNNLLSYANQLEYAGIDYIHIDYLEGENAPLKMKALTSSVSQLPYDVHLITKKLCQETIIELNETPTAYFCVQYEALENKEDLKFLPLFNGFYGIAFTMDTPIAVLERYLNSVNFVLIMCSTPGVSGAKFNEDNICRIQYLRKTYPHLPIHVDGGINNERIKAMEELGVSLCVSGSYLASTEGIDLIRRVCALKFSHANARAMDIMTLRKNLVCISEEADFSSLMENINQTQMGTAFVEDDDGKFVGIITDGDVRRVLMSRKEAAFSLLVRDMVNRSPYCVEKRKQLLEVFWERMLLQKRVTVIPVLENERLVGVLDLKKFF